MKNLKQIAVNQWYLTFSVVVFFILINCFLSIKAFSQSDACGTATEIPSSNMTTNPYTYTATGINLQAATSDGTCSVCPSAAFPGVNTGMGWYNYWFKVTGTGYLMSVEAYSEVSGGNMCYSPTVSVFTGSCNNLSLAGTASATCGVNQNSSNYDPGPCGTAGSCGSCPVNMTKAVWCSTSGTTYYISLGCYSSNIANASTAATIIVRSYHVDLGAPLNALATPSALCGGASALLSGTPNPNSDNNYIKWYKGGCGTGTSLGASVVSVSPTTTTTYYARTFSGQGCQEIYSADCAEVTVTVNLPPAPTAVTPGSTQNICKGDSVKLNATSAGNTIYWFMAPNGGTNIGTSASGEDFYVTPIPSSTYDYEYFYAEAHTPSGCISPRTSTALISVYSLDLSTSVAGYTITANLAGATSYKWIDCNSNLPIPNETGQSFTATSDGKYAVVITNNSCSDTSACVNMINVGLQESNKENKINIYPNPANDQITVQISSNLLGASYTITDKIGRTVMTGQINSERSEINISAFPKGQYLLKFNDKYKQSFEVMKK